MNTEIEPSIEDFIEHMGLSSEADGLPRIAGRMWGFFIIYGGPCSFAELAERLQVSRGSISTNARILRDLGIIERVTRPGDRQDYYRLSENPYDRLLAGYVERMRKSVNNVRTTLDRLPTGYEQAGQRLREMQRFYQAAVTTTEGLIEELRHPAPEQETNDTQPQRLLKQSS